MVEQKNGRGNPKIPLDWVLEGGTFSPCAPCTKICIIFILLLFSSLNCFMIIKERETNFQDLIYNKNINPIPLLFTFSLTSVCTEITLTVLNTQPQQRWFCL